LIGTVYPLIHEAMTDKKLSIGEPYFNELGVPLSVAIVFLMGVGPALPWGRPEPAKVLQRLGRPFGFGIVAFALSFALGARGFLPLLSFGLCGFAFETTLRELWEPATIRAAKKEEGFLVALWRSMSLTRRRTGGYIVHMGVIMIAVAVTGSSSFKQQTEVVLKPGETVQVEEYSLTYIEATTKTEPHRISRIARIQASKNGRDLGILEPKLNDYVRMGGSTIGTPAVKTTLQEDLYLNMVNINDDGSVVGLQVIIEPLMFWLWFGGGVMSMGTLVSAWPSRRKKKEQKDEASA
jgi:cytochrome c-type biogenesis protein CcmF